MTETLHKQLPELLSAVLSASTSRFTQSLDSYSSFLSSASQAVKDCHKCRVSITATSHRPNIHVLASNAEIDKRNNVTLLLIYNCYAQHFQPVDKHAIMSYGMKSADQKPASLSLKGMEYICYDFMIVPKLLTREELIDVWRHMSMDRVTDHHKPILMLSFEEFLELLAKLAIKVFNKKSLMKSLRSKLSDYPTSADAINYLCHYMNLADEIQIRHKIEAIGSRVDDTHPIISRSEKELLDDTLSCSQEKPHINNLKKTIFSSLSTTSLITGKVRKNPKKPFTYDKSKLPVIIAPANHVPSKILQMISDGEEQIQQLHRHTESSSYGHSNSHNISHNISHIHVQHHHHQQPKTASGSKLEDDSDDDDRDNQIYRRPEEEMPVLTYEPSLIRCFDRFCIHKAEADIIDFYDSEGPFVDLGDVCAGQHYRIKLIITNESQDSMNLDVTTCNLESDDVSVSALPGAVVHGLRRHIHISLTITPGIRSVIGTANIHTFTARGMDKNIISCPIHYRVVLDDDMMMKSQGNRCSMKKLATFQRNDPMRYKTTAKPPPKSFLVVR